MPNFVGRLTFVCGDRPTRKGIRACRYSLVFLSTSAHKTVRFARLLSVAGVRVHHASTPADLKCLLELTGAGVLIIDSDIQTLESILAGMAADFPNVRIILLGSPDPELSAPLHAARAWKVIPEPARYFDLWTAIESAHDAYQELTCPVRSQRRVETILMAARQFLLAENQCSGAHAPGRRPLAIRLIRIPVRYTKGQ